MQEKTLDTKIDELTKVVGTLSQTVEKGFADVHKEFGEVRKEIAGVRTDLGKDIDTKIDELAQMTAQGFTELEARIEDCATKNDLIQLRGDVDIMLDKHIGEFRKDYDALAVRVKDLELA